MADDETPKPDDARQGALNPAAGDGVVVIKDPPQAQMLMTPDEADISGIRMLDAADRARKAPPAGAAAGRSPKPRPVSDK